MLSRSSTEEQGKPNSPFCFCFGRRLPKNVEALPILVFHGLLMSCTDLLMLGNVILADNIALGAYLILCLALVLQITCFIRNRKSEGRENSDHQT